MDWRTPTYSAENGNCVEVSSVGTVMIRDAQDQDGVTLNFPAELRCTFAAQVRVDKPASR